MNRIAQSGIVATVAAALSGGGAAVALSGGGNTAERSDAGPVWHLSASGGSVRPGVSPILVGSGPKVTLWAQGAALAEVVADVSCNSEAMRAFAANLSFADPERIAHAVAVTFRFHVVRDDEDAGWMQGRVAVRVSDSVRQDVFAEAGAGQQYVTVFVPPAEVRARGGIAMRVDLLACSRAGGTGSLRLDAIEVVS